MESLLIDFRKENVLKFTFIIVLDPAYIFNQCTDRSDFFIVRQMSFPELYHNCKFSSVGEWVAPMI